MLGLEGAEMIGEVLMNNSSLNELTLQCLLLRMKETFRKEIILEGMEDNCFGPEALQRNSSLTDLDLRCELLRKRERESTN